MPGSVARCPVFAFRPRILHRNPSRLDAERLRIEVPEGLSSEHVREPTFVSPERMQALLRTRGGGGSGLGVVHGLTRAEFSLRFSDFDRQWRQNRRDASFPSWTFQGGDIFLEVTLEVFVLEGDRPGSGDPAGRQIFGVIMEHELEHVADEIDIVSRWMPPRAYRDRMVRRYLADGRPVDDRMFRGWFRTGRFERWLKNGHWAPEHNRRQRRRDSPEAYRALQERIDRLRIRQTNR